MAMNKVVEPFDNTEPTPVVYGGGTVTTVVNLPTVLPNGRREGRAEIVSIEPLDSDPKKGTNR